MSKKLEEFERIEYIKIAKDLKYSKEAINKLKYEVETETQADIVMTTERKRMEG